MAKRSYISPKGVSSVNAGELLGLYARERGIGSGTLVWFQCVVARWSRFLGRESCVDDFTDAAVNAWLATLLDEGLLSRQTVRGYRRCLLMLWRFGFAEGHTDVAPRKVRAIKVPTTIPVAWSAAEVDQLVTAASKLTGCFQRSMILVVWDSGLRLGDVLRLKRSDFDGEGRGTLLQGKTGWPVYFRLRPATLATIAKTFGDGIPERDRIFGDALCRRGVFVGMKRLATAAGLCGGTKKIRKSGASAVERQQPGAAQRYLGHRTPGLAARFYLDPRIVGSDPPRPPELPG